MCSSYDWFKENGLDFRTADQIFNNVLPNEWSFKFGLIKVQVLIRKKKRFLVHYSKQSIQRDTMAVSLYFDENYCIFGFDTGLGAELKSRMFRRFDSPYYLLRYHCIDRNTFQFRSCPSKVNRRNMNLIP